LALPHPEGIWLAQFSGDDSQIVTLGVDEVFRIWRTRDGTLERTVRKPKELAIFSSGVLLEPFDPSLRRIVGVIGLDSLKLENEFIQLLDLTTGQFTGKPFPALRIDGDSTRLRLSPDGTRLANVGTSGTAAIINLQAGELAAPPSKHGGQLVDVEWSRDGKQFLTSGCYYNVEVWDASTGEMMGAPMEGVASAHWSADGRFIATRGDDKLVRVYDAATTEPVTPALPHSGYIRWVCITPSNRLISASDPNLLRAWDLKPTPLAPDIIADYAKFLSGRRLSAGGLLLPIPAKELAKLAQSLRIRAPQLFE
jgi:WD40 repeat protein